MQSLGASQRLQKAQGYEERKNKVQKGRTRFLEGRSGLCWDQQKAPSPDFVMGFYARVQFLPSHYMVIWEEDFYTGFFEYPSSIFGPLVKDYGARFIAYQAMEMKNPLHHFLESKEKEQKYCQWKDNGLKAILAQEAMDHHREH